MEQAQDVPRWRHTLEAGCMELAHRVLDKGPPSHGTCRELAQDALGCEGAPEIQRVEPAQDILVRGDVLETRSAELAQPVLARCSLSYGKCEELAQNAPGCGCALETHCVSPQNMVPD